MSYKHPSNTQNSQSMHSTFQRLVMLDLAHFVTQACTSGGLVGHQVRLDSHLQPVYKQDN
ncbi:hypothetical protein E2C01_034587 [Portunus trituberculatus]|uniref:Uncharacterized protein n=1 Tax=Portunus trituberculatus TaxID=210409 RepID=A0A5B7F651_PORTR|nr:hypothetical protein [Portunus trituberculatus]